jgi:hypothetical protein
VTIARQLPSDSERAETLAQRVALVVPDLGGDDPEGPLMCIVCSERPEVLKGRCRTCYQYHHRNGHDRPVRLTDRQRERDDDAIQAAALQEVSSSPEYHESVASDIAPESPPDIAPGLASDIAGDQEGPVAPVDLDDTTDAPRITSEPLAKQGQADTPSEPTPEGATRGPDTPSRPTVASTAARADTPSRAPRGAVARRTAPPKSPAEVRSMVLRIRKLAGASSGLAKDLPDEYDWLYPSGYVAPRDETYERTRRSVAGGDDKDLGTGFLPQERIRRHLSEVSRMIAEAERAQQSAAALLRGADRHMGKVRAAIDRGKPDTPTQIIPGPEERANLIEAEAARVRRDERIARHATPWAAEERHG